MRNAAVRLTALALCCLVLAGCAEYAVLTNPPKKSATKETYIPYTLPKATSKPAYVPPATTPEEIYALAVRHRDKGSVVTAYSLFRRLGDYKDSRQQALDLRYVLYYRPIGWNGEIAVTPDGKVAFSKSIGYASFYAHLSNWTDIAALNGGSAFSNLGLRADGTVSMFSRYGAYEGAVFNMPAITEEVSKWTEILQITTSDINGVYALRRDGTVLAADRGYASAVRDELGTWTDIIQLCPDRYAWPIGLKEDGTLALLSGVADEGFGLADMKDVIMLAERTALHADGTVSMIHEQFGNMDIPDSWKDIVAVFPDGSDPIAMRMDGSLLDLEGNEYFCYDDIVYATRIAGKMICGVRADGSVFLVYAVAERIPSPGIDQDTLSFLQTLGKVAKPFDLLKAPMMGAEDAAKRFDPSHVTHPITFAFPWLDGKYSRVEELFGTDEIGYLGENVGVADEDGALVVLPEWLVAYPIKDDRFVVCERAPSSNWGDGEYRYRIIDRDFNVLTGAYRLNGLSFIYKDSIYKVGIAFVNNYSQGSFYYLIDPDGQPVDGQVWDDLEFIGAGVIRARRGAQEFNIGTDGKVRN